MVFNETWYLAIPYDTLQYNREFTKMFIEFASTHRYDILIIHSLDSNLANKMSEL